MRSPSCELTSFPPVTPEEKVKILRALLDALLAANVVYLRGRA